MGNGSFSAKVLIALNVVYTVLGLAITATALWFFIEVYNITSLRNSNHYKLDYSVYWPQAIPWLFIFAGVFVMVVSCCGFAGAKKKKRSLVVMYVTFQIIVIILLIIAAIIALVFADSVASDKFITDAIWDSFANMKDEPGIETAFGLIERKLQCCGATSPRDYKGRRNDFPMSCCDTYYHGWSIEPVYYCAITDKLPNERLGCSEVASHHARIVIEVLAAAAIFTAFIGALNLAAAGYLSKALRKPPPKVTVAHYEVESKKVLL